MRPVFHDAQRARAEFIPKVIKHSHRQFQYDAIIFSEAFDDEIRDLILQGLSDEFPLCH